MTSNTSASRASPLSLRESKGSSRVRSTHATTAGSVAVIYSTPAGSGFLANHASSACVTIATCVVSRSAAAMRGLRRYCGCSQGLRLAAGGMLARRRAAGAAAQIDGGERDELRTMLGSIAKIPVDSALRGNARPPRRKARRHRLRHRAARKAERVFSRARILWSRRRARDARITESVAIRDAGDRHYAARGRTQQATLVTGRGFHRPVWRTCALDQCLSQVQCNDIETF